MAIAVTAVATTRLLRYQRPYGASVRTVRKLSSVGASGRSDGGTRKISAVDLKELKSIITSGMTKMMVTTVKTTIRTRSPIRIRSRLGARSSKSLVHR